MASEPQIAFRILGPIEIRIDGRVITLPGGHARSILGLLLLNPNRVLSPEDLIDALWRDDPPRTAPNVLQAHVGTLRRALLAGGDAFVARLETHPSGYRGVMPATGPHSGTWVLVGETGGLAPIVARGSWGAQLLGGSDTCDWGIYGGAYSGQVVAR